MPKPTDIRVIDAQLYILPVELRVPLKFGNQVLQSVKCARVRVRVRSEDGAEAEGWGETPLGRKKKYDFLHLEKKCHFF